MNIWGLPVTAKIIVAVNGVCKRAFFTLVIHSLKYVLGRRVSCFASLKIFVWKLPELSFNYSKGSGSKK